MEWMSAASGGFVEINNQNIEEGMAAQGASCAKVMTDEQMELLRRQISAYAAICKQLVEMHRIIMAQQGAFSGSLSLSLSLRFFLLINMPDSKTLRLLCALKNWILIRAIIRIWLLEVPINLSIELATLISWRLFVLRVEELICCVSCLVQEIANARYDDSGISAQKKRIGLIHLLSSGSGLCTDPLVTYGGGPKISARQRWTPTQMQLQTLESIFYRGNGTPSKQKIKEIVAELSRHGQISEANVYNWFQNRRARSKRKATKTAAAPSNTESESEATSLVEKKAKTETAAAAYSNLSPSVYYDRSPASNGRSQGMYEEAPESSKFSGGSDGMRVFGVSTSTPSKQPQFLG
ncbi:hypothetical protein B296_00038764 [Ensete ventricosum]|uniref:Homeobox domain-containing protein n=1 Tax=Ensete ventricosum TaxID=4639 RepID=A0A426ZJL2_ENSVE|nr:hypothetical protein B296_00038764 [Ensete ventricosum]